MERKIVSGIMLTLLLIMVTLAFNFQPVNAGPPTIIVPDDYEKIQWAIGNATAGDTIFVKEGTYYEFLTISKNNLTLIGENRNTTIIEAPDSSNAYVVRIYGSNVEVSSFTIQNSYKGGVYLRDGDEGIVSRNKINVTSGRHSLYILYSHRNIIQGNTIYGRVQIGLRLAGSVQGPTSYNVIRANEIYFGRFYLGMMANWNTIDNNTISNGIDGMWFTEEGSSLEAPSHNVISRNLISDHWDAGIALWNGINNTFWGNTISNIGSVGLFIIGITEASSNKVYHNDFINNTDDDALDWSGSTNYWDNGYPSGGNYWDDYTGVDLYSGPYQNELGSDGIGDTPYVFDSPNQDDYPLMRPWIPWDITGPDMWAPDGKCDIRDIAIVALLFGSVAGDGRYDPRADITGPIYLIPDGKIDIRDIALVAVHFGETYP